MSKKLDDTGTNHVFDCNAPEIYYRQQFCAVIDAILVQMETRFSSETVASDIESTLLNAVNGRLQSVSVTTLPDTLQVYAHLLDINKLALQLTMLPAIIETAGQLNDNVKVKTQCQLCDL